MFNENSRSSSKRRKSGFDQDVSHEMCVSDSIFQNRISSTRLLNTKEAATYLGISPNALRILVHRGKIEALKLGHRLKFQLSSLRAALQKKEVSYGY